MSFFFRILPLPNSVTWLLNPLLFVLGMLVSQWSLSQCSCPSIIPLHLPCLLPRIYFLLSVPCHSCHRKKTINNVAFSCPVLLHEFSLFTVLFKIKNHLLCIYSFDILFPSSPPLLPRYKCLKGKDLACFLILFWVLTTVIKMSIKLV